MFDEIEQLLKADRRAAAPVVGVVFDATELALCGVRRFDQQRAVVVEDIEQDMIPIAVEPPSTRQQPKSNI